jgi:Mg2+/Co2+ transporter CorB
VPRAWAAAAPDAVALRVAGFAGVAVAILAPIAGMVEALSRPVMRRLGSRGETANGGGIPQESAGAPAPQPAEDGALYDRERLLGVLDLGGRRVEEVMMHRRDIEMIDAEAEPAAILTQAINSPHTRLPIFRGEPENIVGVIHAKDLSRAVHRFVQAHGGAAALEGFDVMDVAMQPYFVPESTPLDEQMRAFLLRRSHFALVVDEYGALQGLVTLEDIIEEIVGDIADEHDIEEPAGIKPQPDGSVEVDGAVSIRDLNRACDWQLPDEEANTIAGLVIHEAQAIPTEGQSYSFHGLRVEVLAREGNRLTRLRLRQADRDEH